jgi:cell wall assembly regulator SMI1
LYKPATKEAIKNAERNLNVSFSPQMKEFVQIYNGGELLEIHLLGIPLEIGRREIPKSKDIVEWNQIFRSYEWWKTNYLLLGSDGFGSYYVADLSKKNETGEYQIVWVDHELIGCQEAEKPFASGYFELIARVVDEMMEISNLNEQKKK